MEGSKLIGAGAATIALAGAALGIGNVFSSLNDSVSRNPSLTKQLFFMLLLVLLGLGVLFVFCVLFYHYERVELIPEAIKHGADIYTQHGSGWAGVQVEIRHNK